MYIFYEPRQQRDEPRYQIWKTNPQGLSSLIETATRCLAKQEPWYDEDATNGDG